MSTEEQTKPFFTELRKQQEDAVSAISKLERIADAVFGSTPTSGDEKQPRVGETEEASARARQISGRCHDLARRFSALVGNGVADVADDSRLKTERRRVGEGIRELRVERARPMGGGDMGQAEYALLRKNQASAGFPLEPLDDRVIVRLIEGEERVTKSGIRLPKTTEVPQRGIVVAVGPGASLGMELTVQDIRRPLRVKVGDVVYFARYAGVELKVDEEDYLALRERDVIAINRRPLRPVTAPAAVDGARIEP